MTGQIHASAQALQKVSRNFIYTAAFSNPTRRLLLDFTCGTWFALLQAVSNKRGVHGDRSCAPGQLPPGQPLPLLPPQPSAARKPRRQNLQFSVSAFDRGWQKRGTDDRGGE